MINILRKIEDELDEWVRYTKIPATDEGVKTIKWKFQQLVSEYFIISGFPLHICNDLQHLTEIRIDKLNRSFGLLYSPSVISYCERSVFVSTKTHLPAEFPKNEKPTTPCKEASFNKPVETTSGLFEFQNGDRFEIPPPGDDWTEIETIDNPWPHVFANDVSQVRGWIETTEGEMFDVQHESGQMMLNEYANRIIDENARILKITRWRSK